MMTTPAVLEKRKCHLDVLLKSDNLFLESRGKRTLLQFRATAHGWQKMDTPMLLWMAKCRSMRPS